jgi:hypothetical protein
MKTAVGITTGYAAWTVVWLIGNALLKNARVLPLERSAPIPGVAALCSLIALSVVCSFVAGYLAQAISRATSTRPGTALGFLLLGTGVVVQWSVFHLMPLWYHITFLALVFPVTLEGTRFAPRNVCQR